MRSDRKRKLLAAAWVILVPIISAASGNTNRPAETPQPNQSVFAETIVINRPALDAARRAHLKPVANAGPHEQLDVATVVWFASRDGFERLSDPAIRGMSHLRGSLARSSDIHTCERLWSSGDGAWLPGAIEKLPDDLQRRWAAMFVAAAMAALESRPIRPPPSPEDLRMALRVMLDGMSPPAQVAFLDLTDERSDPTEAERCQGVRLFYDRVEQMDEADALTITRSLLYPPAANTQLP
jgi:hypothetical protein